MSAHTLFVGLTEWSSPVRLTIPCHDAYVMLAHLVRRAFVPTRAHVPVPPRGTLRGDLVRAELQRHASSRRLSEPTRAWYAREVLPRLVSFSGHSGCGYLQFEADEGEGAGPWAPGADAFIRLLCPDRAPHLVGLFLNACKTERIGREIHRALPILLHSYI